jgi:hypothetical protein
MAVGAATSVAIGAAGLAVEGVTTVVGVTADVAVGAVELAVGSDDDDDEDED